LKSSAKRGKKKKLKDFPKILPEEKKNFRKKGVSLTQLKTPPQTCTLSREGKGMKKLCRGERIASKMKRTGRFRG